MNSFGLVVLFVCDVGSSVHFRTSTWLACVREGGEKMHEAHTCIDEVRESVGMQYCCRMWDLIMLPRYSRKMLSIVTI